MIIDWNIESSISKTDKAHITKAVKSVLKTEKITQPGEVSISILSSFKVHVLNLEYRHLDRTTDVLSFPQYNSLDEIRREKYIFLGDIVINLDLVKQQAEFLGHSESRELAYLTIHSMYHLLGFDHSNESDKKQMRLREEIAYQNMEEI